MIEGQGKEADNEYNALPCCGSTKCNFKKVEKRIENKVA